MPTPSTPYSYQIVYVDGNAVAYPKASPDHGAQDTALIPVARGSTYQVYQWMGVIGTAWWIPLS